MRPLRILQVVGKMDMGGTETWLLQLLRHIDRDRFSMDFLVHTTGEGAYDAEIKGLGAQIIPCLGKSRPWAYARNFNTVLRKNGPYDIVHSHVNYFSGIPLWLAKRAKVPSRVVHSHTFTLGERSTAGPARSAYILTMERLIDRYSTARIAASEAAARSLFGPGWRNDPRCRVIYLGIELAPFEAAVNAREVRQELGMPDGSLVVGHVGRFVETKNHTFLLEIAAEMVRREPNVRLLLVGDGPLRPTIEEQARRLGLVDKVIFAGARRDVPRLLKGAVDIFIFPSLFEGLGLSLIEAQAAGLPCLYSKSITPEVEVVKPLVQAVPLTNSPSVWAELALNRYRSTTSEQRASAFSMVESSPFNIKHNVAAIMDLYESQAIEASAQRTAYSAPSRIPR